MATKFTTWFPDTEHGPLNPIDFGAVADGVAHPLSASYGTLAAAQGDYPSATALTETKDWAAITECWKQAFTTGGVPHAAEAWKNRPVVFSSGKYIINKPLRLQQVEGAHIYGMGGTGSVMIYNETGPTGPDTSCVIADGLNFSRIENIAFNARGGSNSVSFDLGPAGGTYNTHGCLFIGCDFINRDGGIGCQTSAGWQMGSEMTWIRCQFIGLSGNEASLGCHIVGDNALNYQLLACAGNDCSLAWLRVSSGGMVVVQNASLAANGTQSNPDSADIQILAGQAVILGSRTESRRFVNAAGHGTSIIGCSQNFEGNDNIFVTVNSNVYLSAVQTSMGRISGAGSLTIQSGSFNSARTYILSVTNNGSGAIRITHRPSDMAVSHGVEFFSDGDEVIVYQVTGTGAASINGVWKIAKINATTIDLVGSVFGGTYSNLGDLGVPPESGQPHTARLGPGPNFHLRDTDHPSGDVDGRFQTAPMLKRAKMDRLVDLRGSSNRDIRWSESGLVFNNNYATGTRTCTLPFLGNQGGRDISGTYFDFVVTAAQTLRVVVSPESMGAAISSRIFEAGGYHSGAGGWGTEISSNQVGASLRLFLPDTGFTFEAEMAHRWIVMNKSGTWTIAGTPT